MNKGIIWDAPLSLSPCKHHNTASEQSLAVQSFTTAEQSWCAKTPRPKTTKSPCLSDFARWQHEPPFRPQLAPKNVFYTVYSLLFVILMGRLIALIESSHIFSDLSELLGDLRAVDVPMTCIPARWKFLGKKLRGCRQLTHNGVSSVFSPNGNAPLSWRLVAASTLQNYHGKMLKTSKHLNEHYWCCQIVESVVE